jgi:trk system potassium uptake protein TrkA
MHVLIIGAGQVGFSIAERLTREQHDVVMVDTDPDRLEDLSRRLDVGSMVGTGCSPVVLKRAGIERAGMVIAVTDSDEVNLLACLVASALRPDTVLVARVRDPEYHEDPSLFLQAPFHLAAVINPEEEAALRLVGTLRVPGAMHVIELGGPEVLLVCTRVEPGSELDGISLASLTPSAGSRMRIACIDRRGSLSFPRGSDELLAGDIAYFVSRREDAETVLRMAGRVTAPVRECVLAGGGNLSVYLARSLVREGVKVKLMVANAEEARVCAERLPDGLVVLADATDAEILLQEGVDRTDAFVACSNHDEQNVPAALLARSLGARRVMLATSNTTYEHLAPSIGIDAATSPQSAVVGSILRFVRRGRVQDVQALWSRDAEVEELQAAPNSRFISKALKDVSFPRGALVLAVARDGVPTIATGSTRIEAGDFVTVMGSREALAEVEKSLAGRRRGLFF